MSDAPRSVPVSPPPSRPTPTLADLPQTLPLPDELAGMLPPNTYLIEGFLGQGGMGAVYRGVQISLNRPVAIKILQIGIGEGYDFADRFRREAKAMAALNHPNIVNVYDFGAAGGKYLYIVMEFVDGSDLHQVMRARQMTPELALYLVPQICDALAYAHEHGIVHRDIKPANIMLTNEWQVKVADFGLAKRLERADSLVTRSNMSMGTPDYAAPEQFETGAAIDHRADIYALGVTFYQMLTGELPRGAWQPPSAMVKTDKRLDPIVTKAMMPKRDQRYQSARELQRSVIGFSQTLAREQQQRASSAEAGARLEAQKRARAASSGQVPVAGRQGGADTPLSQPSPATKRVPVVPIAMGVAAVLGIGAFFLFSGGEKNETPATSSPPAVKTAATPRPPIKVADNKPESSATVPSASSTFTPGKWVPVKFTEADVSGAASISVDGDKLIINNGWKALPGRVPQARNIALRAHVTHPAEYKPVQFWLRAERKGSESSNAMNKLVMDSYINGDAKANWWNAADAKPVSLASVKGGLPMTSPPGAQITFAAVDDKLIVQRDGRTVITARTDAGPRSGVAVLHSAGRSEFADIEVMILDGVPREQWPDFVREALDTKGSSRREEALASASGGGAMPDAKQQSLVTSAATDLDAPGWKRLDLAKVKEEPGKVERLPDGAVRLTAGRIWTDTSFSGDVAIRARFRGIPDAVNQRVMIRDDNGFQYMANLWSGGGNLRCEGWLGENKGKGHDLPGFPKPDTTKTFTLELRAQGSTLTVLVDGKQVAQAQDDQLKFGRLGVFADRGIVEGIAYQAGEVEVAAKKPGELVWKTQVGGNVNGPASQGADGKVFVATDNQRNLVALNPKDGAILWKCPLSGEPRRRVAPVVADDGSVLIVVHGSNQKGTLHCIEGATGRERWAFSYDLDGITADSSVAVSADGRVFLSHKAAWCLELASGRQVWTLPYPSTVSHTAPLIAANGTVILPAGATVLAVNPLGGTILWQAKLVADVWGDAAVDGRTLYVAAANSRSPTAGMYALDIQTGKKLWENALNSDSPLAVDVHGRIFATDAERHVIACDSASGAKLWQAHDGMAKERSYTIGADGLVYTTLDSSIVCLKPDNGEIVWKRPAGDVMWSAPLLLDDGLLITGSRDKNLYAIQTSSKGLADSPWPTMGQNNRRNGRAAGAQIVMAHDSPVDKKLREIEVKARAEYDAGPGKVFADAASTLRAQYTNALKARATQSQREGNLEHMLAFNEEAEAFASGKRTAPPVEAPGTPAALKQLRETYRKTLAGYEANRDKTSAPIYAKWDAALSALQAELTKASEINEALRVKKLRDQIVPTKALTLAAAGGNDPGGTAPSSANRGSVTLATATPPSRPTMKTAAPVPKVGRVNQRKLAEWVLSVSGSEIQCFKPDGKSWGPTIKKAADLPQIEIELVKVMLSDAVTAKEADLLQLASCPRLTEFRIQANGFNCITPAVIAALGNLPELKAVTLYGVNLEDADFAPLSRCQELSAFRIAYAPKFTGQALSNLSGLKIAQLEMRNCPVKDAALPALARMPHLQLVNLEGLEISEAVFDRLPSGKLTEIRLGKLPQLKGKLAALKRFTKLEILQLEYWSGLSAEESGAVASLPALRFLSVTGISDDVLPLVAASKNLQKLSLQPSSTPQTTFKGLSVFAQHRKLKELNLSGMVRDEALEGAGTLVQLERLSLYDAPNITDAAMPHVAKLTKLTRLSLKKTPITDAGLEPLKTLKKLEELDLTDSKVTRDGAAAIKKALPKCKMVGP